MSTPLVSGSETTLDDMLCWADEDAPSETTSAPTPWRILLVDDDDSVHRATRFVLQGQHILGRPLALFHAYDRPSAQQLLRHEAPFAVILLDVVMDTADAGLQLVRFIRETLQREDTRLILRTGQAGYAPELHVIQTYDINDYKTKDELTHTRLMTTLTTAIRAYAQITTIQQQRRGLELLVHGMADLVERRTLGSLAAGMLTQLATLLHVPAEGFVVQRTATAVQIIAASGCWQRCKQQPLTGLNDETVHHCVENIFTQQSHSVAADHIGLYLAGEQQDSVVLLTSPHALTTLERSWMHAFATTAAACMNHLHHLATLKTTASNIATNNFRGQQ